MLFIFKKKFMSGQEIKNISEVDKLILSKIKERETWIVLDDEFFLDLLKNSLSLNVNDKKKVIDAIPTLTQFQFDELAKVFLEERWKFRELNKQHPEDIKKLLEKQNKEWLELGNLYVISERKQEAQKEDQAKIDALKASLWL